MEAKYSKATIGDLEAQVEEQNRLARGAQKEMIEILIYIKTSGRWKENKRYERATFNTYIEDRFNIRPGIYMEMQTAYVKFPKHTVEYGVGLVSKVMRVCGRRKAKAVLEKLDETKKQLKTELKRAKIEQIIQSNREKPKVEKKVIDWRAKYNAEVGAHDVTKLNLKAAMVRVKELEAQVARLKVTAERFTDIRAIIERPAVQIQPQA